MNSTHAALARGSKVCRPTDWIDVITFFAVNFGLHALTVITPPGCTPLRRLGLIFLSLITPTLGALPAYGALGRMAAMGEDDLEVALISEALCMLVPSSIKSISDHSPHRNAFTQPSLPTDSINSQLISSESPDTANEEVSRVAGSHAPPPFPESRDKQDLLGPRNLKEVHPNRVFIHGQFPANTEPLQEPEEPSDEEKASNGSFPLQYTMVKVPISFHVSPLLKENQPEPLHRKMYNELRVHEGQDGIVPLRLSSNYNIIKSTAAIIQIIYGCLVLYRVSDDQIQRYGYAAYQVTVIPYVLMSLMNLCASLSGPSYPVMYIVLYRGTVAPSATGTAEPAPDCVEVDPSATAGCSEGPDKGPPGPRMAELGDLSKEVYPIGWWDEGDRVKVERKVSGAVGYVYGDFREIEDHDPSLTMTMGRIKRHTNGIVSGLFSWSLVILWLLYLAMPYIVIMMLSNWEPGNSTPIQRSLILVWIVGGHLISPVLIMLLAPSLNKMHKLLAFLTSILVPVLILFPACAGGYIVATMILSDQICTRL